MDFFKKMASKARLNRMDIQEAIRRIQERSETIKPGTPEWKELRSNLEQELKNKKLARELRFFGISADKVFVVCAVMVIAGFGFALDLDSPKALKIAQFVLKLPIVSKLCN